MLQILGIDGDTARTVRENIKLGFSSQGLELKYSGLQSKLSSALYETS